MESEIEQRLRRTFLWLAGESGWSHLDKNQMEPVLEHTCAATCPQVKSKGVVAFLEVTHLLPEKLLEVTNTTCFDCLMQRNLPPSGPLSELCKMRI